MGATTQVNTSANPASVTFANATADSDGAMAATDKAVVGTTYEAEVTTVGAVAGTILTISDFPNDCAVSIQVRLLAIQTAGAGQPTSGTVYGYLGSEMASGVWNDYALPQQLDLSAGYASAGAATWNTSPSNNTIRFTVTGSAGRTVRWVALVQVFTLQPS